MKQILPLPDERILREQIRLTCCNVRVSFPVAVALYGVMVFAFWSEVPRNVLLAWAGLTLAIRTLCAVHAHYLLRADISVARLPRVARQLVVLNFFMGLTWAAFSWIALENDHFFRDLLVLSASMAGAVNTTGMLSPFLPALYASLGAQFAVHLARYSQLDDMLAKYLIAGGVFMAITMIMHGRNSSRATSTAIRLGFENYDLAERLRKESLRATEALRLAEQANQVKTKFLAAASHDLRQPIHALGLFLEVLSRSSLTTEQRQALTNAREVSQASTHMLNTLLDFSRIEAGAVRLDRRTFHMQPVLQKIERELAAQANAKGLVFRTRDTHMAVDSDPTLVEMILRNLVTNAIRYTAQGGLLVACRVRSGTAWLEVWDTGIGIETSKLREIFQEFHQLGNPERDRDQGLGLGLAIVEGMAKRMGHQVVVASKPGRGSVFKLSLPVSSAVVVPDEVATIQYVPQKLNMQVLVIDDDEAVRTAMLQLLHAWGCRCEAVASVEEAVANALAIRPDFVISDYRLRAHNTGAQAIAAVRRALQADVPALLITGDTGPERWREALASGIALLHKPVSPAELSRRMVGLQNTPQVAQA